MTEELKPCPFCGGKAELNEYYQLGSESPEMDYKYWIGCIDCGTSTRTFCTAQKAINVWNSRVYE